MRFIFSFRSSLWDRSEFYTVPWIVYRFVFLVTVLRKKEKTRIRYNEINWKPLDKTLTVFEETVMSSRKPWLLFPVSLSVCCLPLSPDSIPIRYPLTFITHYPFVEHGYESPVSDSVPLMTISGESHGRKFKTIRQNCQLCDREFF